MMLMYGFSTLANALIVALWIVWLVVWTTAAFFVKRTRRREPLVLIGSHRLAPALTQRFIVETPGIAFAALVMVVAGMTFAYWARAHLGRNWSGQVMVKENHTLITSGPYRWVRHPIYSGMTMALVGTALASGAPYGFLGLALILFGFLVRVGQEEALMRETFPADYPEYSRRTARLIPGVY
jgi:protein-S-isoprenylcysteine O-methyltransferase Ste14